VSNEIQNPKLLRRRLRAWFAANGRDLPWRRNHDPYAVMISEFMLQQTQVATVVAYFDRWMREFPTVEALAAADEQRVLACWQGLGYYSRARNLHRAAQVVVKEFDGGIPSDVDALRRLPGVGEYAAGAIAAFAFDRCVPVVDGNIARVLARLFDYRERIDTAAGRGWLRETAKELLPESGGRAHTSALMELGAMVCLPAKPLCLVCPAKGSCRAKDPTMLPAKAERRKTVAHGEAALLIRKNGAVLLEQQTGNRRKGLWRLPHAGARPAGEPVGSVTYPIMHYRVTMDVFPARAPKAVKANQRWVVLTELEKTPIPSPDRKFLRDVLDVPSWRSPAGFSP
jgi:A/G-specific adenine glycosylase